MANNRLFIEDSETGDRLMVAKSFGKGWDWRKSADQINEWLAKRERDSLASFNDTLKIASTLRFRTENEAGFYLEDKSGKVFSHG